METLHRGQIWRLSIMILNVFAIPWMKCGQNQSVEDAWSFKTCVKWFGDWKQELFLCTAEFGLIRYWICWLLCLALCIFQKQTAIFLNFALEAALMAAFLYLHHLIVCSLEELIWDFSWVIVELDVRISWFKLGTCFTIGCFRSGNVTIFRYGFLSLMWIFSFCLYLHSVLLKFL